jgi:hypothetical protein
LQRICLDERLLNWMEAPPISQTLNCRYLLSLDLRAEDQARIHQAAVEQNAASATVAIVATLLGAGEAQDIVEALQQTLIRFTQKLDRLAINFGLNNYFASHELILLSPDVERPVTRV